MASLCCPCWPLSWLAVSLEKLWEDAEGDSVMAKSITERNRSIAYLLGMWSYRVRAGSVLQSRWGFKDRL